VRGKAFGDPYAVLGLAPGATAADVRRAYLRRARLVHPDVAGPAATTRMAELNHARDEILARLPAPGSDDRA
jgi:molecular chaperone DnaJ